MVNLKRNINNRRDAIFLLLLAVAILLLANVVIQFVHLRYDLTAEKKYSLSPSTKKMLKELKDVVVFKVYLEGDMPAGFKRLRQGTRDLLTEMRAYGGKNIQFEFIDPITGKNGEERKAILNELLEKGLAPANVKTGKANEQKLTMVFPCAIAVFGGKEFPIQLLENQIGFGQEETLNNSVISLEYKFANAIQKLTMYRPPRVAFSTGHGELSSIQVADIQQQLINLKYEVANLDITKRYKIDDKFDALIIAKPTVPFDEKDKYKIDQFVMHGGKILWMIDATTASMDSLQRNMGQQFALEQDLNLEDLFFKYGFRINADLIQDISMCNQIPLVVGKMGNAPQTEMFPWYYFPLLISDNNHAIVKNLDPVAAQFCSTIDTIRNADVKKTILLRTSDNSKAVLTPMRVHFGILQQRPNPQYYNQPRLPVAALLEGTFSSLYKNRLSAEFLATADSMQELKFIDKSADTKMIVIADGDIARNEIRNDSTTYPLGYFPYTQQTFANKDFVLNCIQYLVDNSGILETRNKDVKLRLLNKVRVEQEKTKWQLINIVLPILVVLGFGFLFSYYRKKKYTS
jgi:ABC-2 type transport system permease protein